MADSFTRKEGTSPSDEYIRLGLLLQKERSSARQTCVDAILRSKTNLKSIIEQIVLVDHADDRHLKALCEQWGPRTPPGTTQNRGAAIAHEAWKQSRAYLEKPHKHTPQENAPAPDSKPPVEESEQLYLAKHNQHKIKINPLEQTFFKYVLHDFARIRSFGVRSGTMHAVFPFQLRLNRNIFETVWPENMMKAARDILAALESFPVNGWRVLEKFEYNCLVLLVEFSRALLKVEWGERPVRNRLLVHRLRDVERLFLVLHHDRSVMDAIASALEKLATAEAERAEDYRVTAQTVKALLYSGTFFPSLHNLILALNMIHTRCFLSLSDLIDARAGVLVAGEAYDCPDDVGNSIRAFIGEQEDRISRLARERDSARSEHAFIPLDRKGEIDYAPLSAFYNVQAQAVKGGAFREDAEQALFFLVRFCDFFIGSFRPLFCGTLVFDPPESGVLFPEDFLGPELERFALTLKRLERHTFSYGSLSRQRYLEIRRRNKISTRIEGEAISLSNEILAGLRVMAQKLSTAIRRGNVPLDVPSDRPGRPIPFPDKIIRNQGVLSGKKVSEALPFAVGIAYGAGLFMADPSLYQMIGKETPLCREIEMLMQTVERVGSRRECRALREKYRI